MDLFLLRASTTAPLNAGLYLVASRRLSVPGPERSMIYCSTLQAEVRRRRSLVFCGNCFHDSNFEMRRPPNDRNQMTKFNDSTTSSNCKNEHTMVTIMKEVLDQ